MIHPVRMTCISWTSQRHTVCGTRRQPRHKLPPWPCIIFYLKAYFFCRSLARRCLELRVLHQIKRLPSASVAFLTAPGCRSNWGGCRNSASVDGTQTPSTANQLSHCANSISIWRQLNNLPILWCFRTVSACIKNFDDIYCIGWDDSSVHNTLQSNQFSSVLIMSCLREYEAKQWPPSLRFLFHAGRKIGASGHW